MCLCPDQDRLEGGRAIEFEKQLVQVAFNSDDWRTLFKCSDCDTYWEETRMQTELQGGGFPILSRVTKEYVAREWGIRE